MLLSPIHCPWVLARPPPAWGRVVGQIRAASSLPASARSPRAGTPALRSQPPLLTPVSSTTLRLSPVLPAILPPIITPPPQRSPSQPRFRSSSQPELR